MRTPTVIYRLQVDAEAMVVGRLPHLTGSGSEPGVCVLVMITRQLAQACVPSTSPSMHHIFFSAPGPINLALRRGLGWMTMASVPAPPITDSDF
jgi:hypothetical protein